MAVSIGNMRATFASSSYRYDAISMNVNTIAYAANSTLINLKVKGDSKFYVDVTGNTSINGTVTIAGSLIVTNTVSTINLISITSNTITSNIITSNTITSNTITSNTINTWKLYSTSNVLVGRTSDSTVGQSVRLDVAGAINASALLIDGIAPIYGATIYEDSEMSTRYVTFIDSTSGVMTKANVNTTFTYDPISGTLSSTIFNALSDENLKKDITVIDSSLEKIEKIKGVTFKWKDNNKECAGVIAQDVEKVLPCLVEWNKSVNYNGIIGLLVEAVKELKKEIEYLKKNLDI